MTIADINTLARFLTNTTSADFTDANLLILINNAYERIVGNIISQTMGGKWIFGDSNFSALPTATTNLVNAQALYQLAGDGSSTGINTTHQLLNVLGVEVLDVDGNYYKLDLITLAEIYKRGSTPSEFEETDGRPIYYELREDFAKLYPAPDDGVSVTLAAGLKVLFQRTAALFTSAEVTTGTKEPGFPSPWHDMLAYDAAYQYAVANGLPNANQIKSEFLQKESDLEDFITRRSVDDRPQLSNKRIDSR